MGSMIEQAIEKAISALVNNDVELAKTVIEGDEDIDHQERRIESLCMKLLLQQQPVAKDFRLISSALKMFMILYQIAKPMTAGHRVLMVGMVAGWLFCMIFVSHLFAIRDISGQCMMLTAVFTVAAESILRYLSKFVEWMRESLLVLKKKIHQATA